MNQKVIALRDIHCFARSRAVVSHRSLQIASHFQEVCANGIHAVVFGDSRVALERVQQIQTLFRAMHHRRGDCVIQDHHRIVRHTFQQLV